MPLQACAYATPWGDSTYSTYVNFPKNVKYYTYINFSKKGNRHNLNYIYIYLFIIYIF